MKKSLTIFTDGGSRGNPGASGIGVVVYEDGTEVPIWEKGQYIGTHTNNEAEYLALKVALEWLGEFLGEKGEGGGKIDKILFKLDSKLVVEQMLGNWKIKEMRLKILREENVKMVKELGVKVDFKHVPRAENAAADALVNNALDEVMGK